MAIRIRHEFAIKRMAVPGRSLSFDDASIRAFGHEISFEIIFIYSKNAFILL